MPPSDYQRLLDLITGLHLKIDVVRESQTRMLVAIAEIRGEQDSHQKHDDARFDAHSRHLTTIQSDVRGLKGDVDKVEGSNQHLTLGLTRTEAVLQTQEKQAAVRQPWLILIAGCTLTAIATYVLSHL